MNKIFFSKICILAIFASTSYALDVDKHLELSYVQTSGNSNTSTFSTKVEASTALSDKSNFRAKGNILYSENDNDSSANKYDIELDYNYMLSEKIYSYFGVNYLKDQFSDYDYRLNAGPGLGYKLLDDKEQTIDLQGGLDYALDQYSDGIKDEYVASRAEVNYRYKINENLKFKQMFNYLVSLEDNNKYFMASDTSLGVKMTDNLSLGVSYRIDYVNQTSKEHADRKLLTSLIIDF
ncbi:MAG: YdiY family protein [Candidatus Paceibacteria bacterium]